MAELLERLTFNLQALARVRTPFEKVMLWLRVLCFLKFYINGSVPRLIDDPYIKLFSSLELDDRLLCSHWFNRSTVVNVSDCNVRHQLLILFQFRIYNFINPHLPNELTHPYQLDESIFHLRSVWCTFFHFYHIFDRNSCEQTVQTLIRRRVLWHLIWVCIVCLCPKKGTPGIYGLIRLLRQQHLGHR